MRIRTTLRALGTCAIAASMLIAAPAAQAKRHHRSTPRKQQRSAPYSAYCSRVAKNSRLTDAQKAAVAAACAQLKADLQAAQDKFDAAVAAARGEVKQASDAVAAACGNGQGDTQGCQDARAAAEQAKRQARQEVKAAGKQLKEDTTAAVAAFKAALKAALGTNGPTGGDKGGSSGGGVTEGGRCGDLVSNAPADKRAALSAACAQLAADTQAAQAAFNQTTQTLRGQYADATAAVKSACQGQEDSQACRDARAAFENTARQVRAGLAAASAKLQADLAAAMAKFRATVQSVLGSQGTGVPSST